jgi:hypothetical protein
MFRVSILFLYTFYASGLSAAPVEKDKCTQHIEESVCLVDEPATEKNRFRIDRTCLPGSEIYKEKIIETYKTFPPFVQQVLCGVKKIYIEKDFYGAAWSAMDDPKKLKSPMIGILKKDLDSNLKLQDFLTWFEQLSFGGATDYLALPNLPLMVVSPPEKKEYPYLSLTLLHELGHILDYQKFFNDFKCKGNKCKPAPASWTEISWQTIEKPKPDFTFKERNLICINRCKDRFINVAKADQFYDDLHSRGFLTQLAAFNAKEDWADTFAFYVSGKYMDIHFQIKSPKGKVYNFDDLLNSKAFARKKQYLESKF